MLKTPCVIVDTVFALCLLNFYRSNSIELLCLLGEFMPSSL